MAVSHSRIIFVTGKGGTGKSRLAHALAEAASAGGLSAATLTLAEPYKHNQQRQPDQRGGTHIATQSLSRAYDHIVIDRAQALRTIVLSVVRLAVIADRLLQSSTFTALAAAAPGLSDLAALATIAGLKDRLGQDYDLVVVDAPASGHSLPILTSPARVGDFVNIGPIASLVNDLDLLLHDRSRMATLVVTTPEELAMIEAAQLVAQLGSASMAPAHIVVNALWPSPADDDIEQWLSPGAVSSDALSYIATSKRQAQLTAEFEKEVGPTLRVGHDFGSLNSADMKCEIDVLFHALWQSFEQCGSGQ